ncbi:MAG: D-alanyl-D-alanine carboxypeptidase [Firmicutes bacterium]|nr:D-alanyl-D-alanine carboxypeptidase [Bacillota bacterium]
MKSPSIIRNGTIVFAALLLAASVLWPAAALAAPDTPADETEVQVADELLSDCRSAILLDGASGDVLYEQNADLQCYPASVTKLMTLILILEAVDNGSISLEDTVSVSEAAAAMGGSQVYLYPGEQRTVNEMLIAIAVGSGNDAAYAMAEFVGGSYEHFIEMMNQKAAALGMDGTHFVNPHGLHDPEHYTTARDLGKLARYAINVPGLLSYTSIYEYEFRPQPQPLTLWNTNRLLKWYAGTDGLKTGYTEEAGRNLAATAQRDGLRLISVVLGCRALRGHFSESMNLLNYGFDHYKFQTVYRQNETVAQANVAKGETAAVDLLAAADIGYVCPKNGDRQVSVRLEIPAYLDAPLAAGEHGGLVQLYENDRLIEECELIVARDVERCGLFRFWLRLLAEMGF